MTAEPNRIRVLIVDDERLARRRIRLLTEAYQDVEIVGECASGREAISAIVELGPDLVFLDVQMPEIDGFGVLETVPPDRLPAVIFVTAYDRYAIRAFEFCAVDYLLKPFGRERFEKALGRAREQLEAERRVDMAQRTLALLEQIRADSDYLNRIVVKTPSRVFFVKIDDIDWIEAEGKYARLHTGKQSYLLRMSIGSLEAGLDPRKFSRIHRSAIARIDSIRDLQPWFNGEYKVILRDGSELTLSRNRKKKLAEILGSKL